VGGEISAGPHVGWAIKHQAADGFGNYTREVLQNSCPLGHSDKRCALHAQMPAQHLNVRSVVCQGGHSRRKPAATPIESDQPEAARESVDLRLPHVQIESPTVDQHDYRATTLVAVTQPGG
jgi:hypothetical protein